eukprot:3941979-Rhodomonas_salina.5
MLLPVYDKDSTRPKVDTKGGREAVSLRMCCAMSGTNTARAKPGTEIAHAIFLLACYAMSGTDTRYAATRKMPCGTKA